MLYVDDRGTGDTHAECGCLVICESRSFRVTLGKSCLDISFVFAKSLGRETILGKSTYVKSETKPLWKNDIPSRVDSSFWKKEPCLVLF